MEGNLIKINKWLYPVSWIYGTGVWLRNKLFDWGIYKERKFDIPVISVGNILSIFKFCTTPPSDDFSNCTLLESDIR